MFEQVFKNLDKILREDDGVSTETEYVEQTSWILFLKWIDDYSKEKEKKSQLNNTIFKPIFSKEYQWSSWAVIKTADGKVDFNKNLQGPDLKKFVDEKLFPYLSSFKEKAENFNTLEYKIGEIFTELKNKLQDGYTLRDMLDEIDSLQFKSSEQKYELSDLYEERIKKMGNAGRNGGEFYTPRPLIKTIVKIIDPKIGETVYDPAVGSAGFLVETYDYIKKSKSLTVSELNLLETKTLYGAEKKLLAYIIGNMNMILHGVETPNIIRTNSLTQNILEIENKDRVDVILANPPFGSQSEKENIQESFPIKSGETAYLFLQHFIKKLKVGGRCGVVIKNTFLTNDDAIELRKQLLSECNLHTILDLPRGTFQGAKVPTVVLFFEKGKSTNQIWYYKLNLERNLGKRNPLNELDLKEFVKLAKERKSSENSWTVDIENINKEKWDLTVNNPNKVEVVDNRTPQEIINEIEELNAKAELSFKAIKDLL